MSELHIKSWTFSLSVALISSSCLVRVSNRTESPISSELLVAGVCSGLAICKMVFLHCLRLVHKTIFECNTLCEDKKFWSKQYIWPLRLWPLSMSQLRPDINPFTWLNIHSKNNNYVSQIWSWGHKKYELLWINEIIWNNQSAFVMNISQLSL